MVNDLFEFTSSSSNVVDACGEIMTLVRRFGCREDLPLGFATPGPVRIYHSITSVFIEQCCPKLPRNSPLYPLPIYAHIYNIYSTINWNSLVAS